MTDRNLTDLHDAAMSEDIVHLLRVLRAEPTALDYATEARNAAIIHVLAQFTGGRPGDAP